MSTHCGRNVANEFNVIDGKCNDCWKREEHGKQLCRPLNDNAPGHGSMVMVAACCVKNNCPERTVSQVAVHWLVIDSTAFFSSLFFFFFFIFFFLYFLSLFFADFCFSSFRSVLANTFPCSRFIGASRSLQRNRLQFLGFYCGNV